MKNAKVSFAVLLLSICLISIRCAPDTTGVVPSTEDVLIRNIWSVDYFFSNQDMTNDFGSSRILFSSTGVVGYQKNGETVPGSWSKTIDPLNNEVLLIHFNTTDPNILKLNESWKVTSRSTSSLQFEENSGGSILFRLKTQ